METLRAPAKINLFLRVLAREESGFHQLETLFVSLSFGDVLELTPAPSGIALDSSGLSAGPTKENLAFRAAEAFFLAAGIEAGVRIRLEKDIPPRAGLGGGSSDAAATLKGLSTLFPGALDSAGLFAIASRLGSDVPFFLSPSPLTLAWGRGERLLPLEPLPPTAVLIALPPLTVSTPEAFESLARERRRLASQNRAPTPRVLSLRELSSWENIGRMAENDFEPVVFGMHPLLEEIKGAIERTEPIFSLLSGSGSAVFGLFDDEGPAEEARASLAAEFPDTRFLLTWTESGLRGL